MKTKLDNASTPKGTPTPVPIATGWLEHARESEEAALGFKDAATAGTEGLVGVDVVVDCEIMLEIVVVASESVPPSVPK